MNRDRLMALVLARVVTARAGMTAAEAAKATVRFAPGRDARAWGEQVEQAWGRLVSSGDVTAAGTAATTAHAPWPAFGLRGATPWKRLVERVVPALGLGVAADDSKAHARLADRDGWAAAIVARAEGLWTQGPPPTMTGLCDALVWRALGLAGPAKRTPREIRGLFAGRLLGESGAHDRSIRLLAAREVGAQRADLRALRDALGSRWVAGQELRGAIAPRDGQGARDGGNGELAEFAEAVRAGAQAARDGVFGDRKVFIAALWRSLAGRPPVDAMDLDTFKRRLVDIHRAGQVSLVRADLVGAMDPELVAASETASGDARFHFVVREVVS